MSATYPVKVTNFLAYVASGSVGGAALATTCVRAGAIARAGPGGFPQCLYMNGVPRGPSYLCALLICSFLGTTCADGLVQREVFLLKEVLNGVAVQEAFNYLVSKCSFKCKEQSISCKSGQLPEADEEVIKRLARLLYIRGGRTCVSPSTYCWMAVVISFTLLLAEAKVLYNSDCLVGETQGERLYQFGLYQFGSTLFVEAR